MVDIQDHANAPALDTDPATAAAAAAAARAEEQRRVEEEARVDAERRRGHLHTQDFGPEGMLPSVHFSPLLSLILI